jgi:hypothetical protein
MAKAGAILPGGDSYKDVVDQLLESIKSDEKATTVTQGSQLARMLCAEVLDSTANWLARNSSKSPLGHTAFAECMADFSTAICNCECAEEDDKLG